MGSIKLKTYVWWPIGWFSSALATKSCKTTLRETGVDSCLKELFISSTCSCWIFSTCCHPDCLGHLFEPVRDCCSFAIPLSYQIVSRTELGGRGRRGLLGNILNGVFRLTIWCSYRHGITNFFLRSAFAEWRGATENFFSIDWVSLVHSHKRGYMKFLVPPFVKATLEPTPIFWCDCGFNDHRVFKLVWFDQCESRWVPYHRSTVVLCIFQKGRHALER